MLNQYAYCMLLDLKKRVQLQLKLQSKISGLIKNYCIFISIQNGSHDQSGHTCSWPIYPEIIKVTFSFPDIIWTFPRYGICAGI